jgi:predicted transposase YbfD/YdcC
VALSADGEWLAAVGFGAASLACQPRDRFIGWDEDQHFRRLRYVTNNQRLCVLPAGRRPNLASNVLAKTLKRLSADFECRWGHPIVMVETFVDPARHYGTCYLAGGFRLLGETLGYGRSSGRYYHHGRVKLALARLLRRDACRLLSSAFDHPELTRKRSASMLDLSAATFNGEGGLLEALEGIPDHRKARGVRHPLASILAIASCATLAGARSMVAVAEYANDCPQDVLARLGAKYHPDQKRYIAPHHDTIHRALAAIDTAALDRAIGAWLYAQVTAGHLDEAQVSIALDGKAVRGSLREDGRALHLFSAMVHGAGIVIGQEEVDQKSNEITALRPLLEPIDITGAVVTADAMHCQRDHARYIVEDKKGDYLLQLKDNQPTLLAAIKAIDPSCFSAEHYETCRGHGRVEHRYVRVSDVPEGFDFPHAAQVVLVYRERANLADVMTSSETSYYLTSVTKERGTQEQLGRHVREHWGIENKVHWVRDWNFDEDRHQHRAAHSPARALTSLRNLAISLLRLAGADNIAAALRWVSRDATRAAALIGV